MNENTEKVAERVVSEGSHTVLTKSDTALGDGWFNLYVKKKDILKSPIPERSSAFKMMETAESFFRKKELGMVV